MMTPCFWPDARLAPSTSRTCGARPGGACPAWCSTTSTAAPTPRSRCARTAASSKTSTFGRARRREPQADLRTTVLGTPDRDAVPLAPVGSSRHVLSARRGSGRARRRRGRHDLHPVDAVGVPARGRRRGVRAARSGISCIWSADATSRRAAIERARAAGFTALVVTIDTPVAGLRERDLRNGVKELRVAQAVRDAAASAADSRAAALARRAFSATAA